MCRLGVGPYHDPHPDPDPDPDPTPTPSPTPKQVFLNRLLGRSNTLNDLPSLDPQLAKSLLFLKSFDGDVEGLCLNFAIEQFTVSVRVRVKLVG